MELENKIYTRLPEDAKKIRTDVFVIEQGFKEEFDEQDNNAIHIVIYYQNVPIGTSRVIYSDKHHCYCIGRFAIVKEYRSKQFGKKLMEITEDLIINKLGHILVGVSSQERVADFYEKLGYQKTEERYLDQDCPHIWMVKHL